ncbi:insulinase family protein [Acinetobacter lactucae]|uniref:insulinase family protein n=1 Tax=Acinetobacter lactucae TaxID=1785128 RepID=UPI00077E1B66|nr:insulinase family protein [Acinetobacter lactucae]
MSLPYKLLLSTQKTHPAFELIRQRPIKSTQIIVQQYRHKVTGAAHYHLVADYEESAFMVALRTQPMNSKGEAHILEHTVLCGSQNFPIRDPFFGMMRRSLNTFMNAMTNSDWTSYLFATQNNKDFQNLLTVYLDAVFAPNIHPLDFAQEGIRLELNANDQPEFKGIVFNEMKGALTPPSRQLHHRIEHHLYNETTYHYNSGGEPIDIIELTHAELMAFYKKHYHPSNSIFMTFGKQSVYELHEQFETLALAKFKQGECLSSKFEPRWTIPKQFAESYAVEDNNLSNKTYHTLSWLLPTAKDIQLWFGLRLMSGVLLQNSASPLLHYLETCSYAKTAGPILGLNDQNYEMTFICSVQGGNPKDAEQFKQDVLSILTKVASEVIETNVIDALFHQIELEQREISNGMPYGLSLFFNGLSQAVHHHDPFHIWDIDSAISQVKQKIKDDPMWISNLIQIYLIDNPHRVQLTFFPDNRKPAQIYQLEKDKLNKRIEQLKDKDRDQLRQQAALLKQRQEYQEKHDILPKVTVADVPAEIPTIQGESTTIDIAGEPYSLHIYPTGTNGIYYHQVLIDIPDKVLKSPYFFLYALFVGQLGAGEYDYLQLQQLQTAVSGGCWMSISLRNHVSDKKRMSSFFVLSTKSLTQRTEAIGLLRLAFEQLRFDEKSRIIELLQQQKVQWQSSLSNSGQFYAMQSAARHMSAFALHQEYDSGLTALNRLSEILDDITQNDAAYAAFIEEINAIHRCVLQASKQFLLVCEELQVTELKRAIQKEWSSFHKVEVSEFLSSIEYSPNNKNQAWLIEGDIQFCAQAYPAVTIDHKDAPIFMVLGAYLTNGFLHHAIREQGGAYGGGARYDTNACAFLLYSYRDPRLIETFADFDLSLKWLLQQKPDHQLLESAILTIISSIDKPTSPAGEAISIHHGTTHGRTIEMKKNLRKQILNVKLEDLKRIVKSYLHADVVKKSVVAPVLRAEQVEKLGFELNKVI